MFEEKVTLAEFRARNEDVKSVHNSLWKAITELERIVEKQEDRLDRYSARLTKIIDQIDTISKVVDHNAIQGSKANDKIVEAFSAMDELKTAIELLATDAGTKITVLPPVETLVTIHPGLPERLSLEKLTKSEQKQKQSLRLPKSIQFTADELAQGLSLVE